MFSERFCRIGAFSVLLLLLSAGPVYALDLSVRFAPSFAFPDSFSEVPVTAGGLQINVGADIELFNLLRLGPDFNYQLLPLVKFDASTSNPDHESFEAINHVIYGGLRAGLYFYPLSRLSLSLSGAGGIYEFFNKNNSYSDLWWNTTVEAGFRFSPSFTLSVCAGYTWFNNAEDSDSLVQNIHAGILARYNISTNKQRSSIQVEMEVQESVFPLLYQAYANNGFASLLVRNQESAEIRDVSVYFSAGNYTSSRILCGQADLIQRRGSVQIPLLANFSELILNFTENGQIPGELTIEYKLLGAATSSQQSLLIPIYNRNSIRWFEPDILASFVSPNAPEIMDLTKYLAGIARDKLRSGLNRNMQFAMYLYEGLVAGGMKYSEDQITPYSQFHADSSLLDFVQYPFQTLAYGSGDLDDIAILFCAALESIGIPSALIPTSNDMIAAFSLGISPQAAQSLFHNTNMLLTIGDTVWIPLSFAAMKEGFINSWYSAMAAIESTVQNGENLHLSILSEAWTRYPPVTIKGSEANFPKAEESLIIKAVETNMLRYISTEFGPKLQQLIDEIKTDGPNASRYSQLGLLYVRAGMYTEAKSAYSQAAQMGSVAALINLGNIAMLQREYQNAVQWFKKALEQQPNSEAAERGLTRALAETEF